MLPLTRDAAVALDAADPLAAFRERFVIADPELIYLDGNSLGRLPKRGAERLTETVQREWGDELVRGWDHWMDEPARVGDVLARDVLGAEPGEVLVGDTTTVNLFKLVAAAAGLARRESSTRTTLVTTASNFPTDRYVTEGLGELLDLRVELLEVDMGTLAATLERELAAGLGARTAVLCLSHVDYASGELHDIAALTALARGHGIRVVWDLSHSAGAVPVRLAARAVELAVGCTYKYLNAGPGAPAYLYVRRDLQQQMRSPIWGWFSQRDQFAMSDAYNPAAGVVRFATGTPPILGLPLVEVGAQLIGQAGIDALAAKSERLTALLIELADAWLTPHGFTLATPREAAHRGGHVNLAHAQARDLCQALIEKAGVVPDFRADANGAGTIRLGPAPLYTRYVDVWDAMDRLRKLATQGAGAR